MISRLNNALDKYWALASDSAPKGSFDDVNNSTTPVETQNLLSGTNSYKISDFTNEVLQILRIAILDDDGLIERDLIREEFDDIRDFKNEYSTDTDKRGVPTFWTKRGDFILMRLTPNYSETGGLRVYVNRELSKFAFVTCTISNASPGVVTAIAHGLSNGDSVIFETDGGLPTGLTPDTVVYYLVNKADNTFEVSLTIGGTAINTSSAGSGNHKFTKVNKAPGIPVIHHDYLARHAALPFLIEKKLAAQKKDIGNQIALNQRDIQDYWQIRGRELKTIMRTKKRLYK